MKLDIGGDDDLRYVRREKVPDRTPDRDAVKCCFVALKNHPPKQNPAIWKPTSLRRAPLGALTSVRNLYRVWKVLFWHGDLRKERTYPLTRTQVIKSTLDHSIGRERFFELDGNEAPTLRFASLSQHDTGALCDHPRRSEENHGFNVFVRRFTGPDLLENKASLNLPTVGETAKKPQSVSR